MKNLFGILREIFRGMTAGLRWVLRPITRRLPKPRPKMAEIHLGEFSSPEEAIEYLRRHMDHLTLYRIDNMRRWEISTKRFTVINLCGFLLQIAILAFLRPLWLHGAVNIVVAVFIYTSHTISLQHFRASRDQLLDDLEKDPRAELWWYEAWTKKGTP